MGRVENAKSLAVELGCKIGSLPTIYLDLPFGAKHNSLEVCDGVEERFRRRLRSLEKAVHFQSWKAYSYNKHPILHGHYIMSLFLLPKSVKFRLGKFKETFYGKETNYKRKYTWLNGTLSA